MTKILYVEASPRKQRSHSIAVAKAFIEKWHTQNPGGEIDTLDLWHGNLPEFGADAISAKHHSQTDGKMSNSEAAAWKAVTELAARVQTADIIVFSSPMWNFMVPYRLKQFMDVITQPGIAFEVTEDGQFLGLLTGKKAIVLRACGGDYAIGTPAAAFDFFRPYFDGWLGFVGITDVEWLDVAPTEGSPATAAAARNEAIHRAGQLVQA